MEYFNGSVPVGWEITDPDMVRRITARGLVHSGESSVGLSNGADLRQEITPIQEGCYYEFSFFAHSDGANVGMSATLTYLTETGEEPAGEIVARQMDIPTADRVFSYYRVITSQAPKGVKSLLIEFNVVAQGNQSLQIDDVSFSTL
jgi:hypothetical protein